MILAARVGLPAVSVVMSCYNGGRWLAEAIDSVLAQTYHGYEFIIVDDGSNDDSWAIIQAYAALDERVVALKKRNTGTPDSLNAGVAVANGRWIARLDADDVCEPTRLAEQVAFMLAHPGVVLLGSGFIEINEQGQELLVHTYPSGHRALLNNLERLQRFFPTSSAFFRTDCFRAVGGYNLRMWPAEDWRLWFELVLKGEVACLPAPLVRIRKHGAQVTNVGADRAPFLRSVAGAACHRLRAWGEMDPSVDGPVEEWVAFLAWVDQRIETTGVFARQKVWKNARQEYLTAGNRLVGALILAWRIASYSHAPQLIREKLFGTPIGTEVARDWRALLRHTPADSSTKQTVGADRIDRGRNG